MGATLRDALLTALERASRPRSLLALFALGLAFSGGTYLLAAPWGAALSSKGYGPSELLAPGGAALFESLAPLQAVRLEPGTLATAAIFIALTFLLRAFLFFLAQGSSQAPQLGRLFSAALAIAAAKLGGLLLAFVMLALLARTDWFSGGQSQLVMSAPWAFALWLCLSRAFEISVGVVSSEQCSNGPAFAAWLSIFPSALRRLRQSYGSLLGISLLGLGIRAGLLALVAQPLWNELRGDAPWRLLAIAQLSLVGNLWGELFSAALATVTQPVERGRPLAEGPSKSAL